MEKNTKPQLVRSVILMASIEYYYYYNDIICILTARVSFRNFAKGGNWEETKHLGGRCENCTILSYMYYTCLRIVNL